MSNSGGSTWRNSERETSYAKREMLGPQPNCGLVERVNFSHLPDPFMFYGLRSKGPQMTVIFKHLTSWGDTSSPSSFGDELKAGVRRRLNGKRLNDRDSSPSPLPSWISGGRAFTPGGAKEATAQRQEKKKKKGETWVMDKPVVSVGEPGGEGAAVGAGM